MLNWQIEAVLLELKYTWKISRNSSTHKKNFIITCNFNNWKGIGEAAPNIRYLETPEVMVQEFERFIQSGGNQVHDLEELTALLNQLKLKNALRFGIESAYIHMLCHAEKIALPDFLGITPCLQKTTSYTMPILELDEVVDFYHNNNLQRFAMIKLKINAENGLELIKLFATISNQPLIVDANEAYTNADDLLRLLYQLKPYPIKLIEQPMPASCVDDYMAVKKAGLFPLMADESVCDDADFGLITQQFDCVNMKLMKAGGYLNGLHILQQAKAHGLQTMIGCMVETSLGISSALSLCGYADYADLDGFLIVKNEPLHLTHESDGIVYHSALSAPVAF